MYVAPDRDMRLTLQLFDTYRSTLYADLDHAMVQESTTNLLRPLIRYATNLIRPETG